MLEYGEKKNVGIRNIRKNSESKVRDYKKPFGLQIHDAKVFTKVYLILRQHKQLNFHIA